MPGAFNYVGCAPVNDSDKNTVYAALLTFSSLDASGRDKFISWMNEFLMASPQQRKSMQSQWAEGHREGAVPILPIRGVYKRK